MDADAIMNDVKSRFAALAVDPPFRFRKTSRRAAEAFMRRLTTFEGYSDSEIDNTQAELGVTFTEVFRAYFRHMGRARGELFLGSAVAKLEQMAQFREWGQRLMHATDRSLALPVEAVVYLTHQGYQFQFVKAVDAFDSEAFVYTETESTPRRLAPTFGDWLRDRVRFAEELHRRLREGGGSWITARDDGGASEHFPARSSGERPLDHPFQLGE